MSTNETTGGISKDEALRASYWEEVLRILGQSDVALKTAGLREDDILRIEHNEARTAVAALIAERDAQAKRIAELETALNAVLPFAAHSESCGDADAYNNSSVPSCGCGLDSAVAFAQEAIGDGDAESKS